LIQTFYSRALSAHQDAKTAESYAAKQPMILQEVFKDQNLDDEAIREIFNTFEIRNQDIKNLYQESVRLVVPPTLPTVFLSFLIVWCRAWWQKVSAQA